MVLEREHVLDGFHGVGHGGWWERRRKREGQVSSKRSVNRAPESEMEGERVWWRVFLFVVQKKRMEEREG